jgi:hypothetical protein
MGLRAIARQLALARVLAVASAPAFAAGGRGFKSGGHDLPPPEGPEAKAHSRHTAFEVVI